MTIDITKLDAEAREHGFKNFNQQAHVASILESDSAVQVLEKTADKVSDLESKLQRARGELQDAIATQERHDSLVSAVENAKLDLATAQGSVSHLESQVAIRTGWLSASVSQSLTPLFIETCGHRLKEQTALDYVRGWVKTIGPAAVVAAEAALSEFEKLHATKN